MLPNEPHSAPTAHLEQSAAKPLSTGPFQDLKVALVHDWLVSVGGGEKVLKYLHELFPQAPIYTLVFSPDKAPAWYKDCDIRTSPLQKIPGATKFYRYFLPIMPTVWDNIDLTDYDLVISSCSSCAKGVITAPDAIHVSYCHSPTRYIWDLFYSYRRSKNSLVSKLLALVVKNLRLWDFQAAQRVDYFVANSNFIANRIQKFYRRSSRTIYPGVEQKPLLRSDSHHGDYYLIVSRLVNYKRIDLAIRACNNLGKRLIVAGAGGEEYKHLRSLAGPTIQFEGFVSDDKLNELYRNARALLFPGLEDFGIAPVEAMSAGIPVIAYGRGGATETVVPGKNGILFTEQTVEALSSAIVQFEATGVEWTAGDISAYAKQFSVDRFKAEMVAFLSEVVLDDLHTRRDSSPVR